MGYTYCANSLKGYLTTTLPTWVDNNNCLVDSTNALFGYLGSHDKTFGCLIQYGGFITKPRRITTWQVEIIGVSKITADDTVDSMLTTWIQELLGAIETSVTLSGSVIRAQVVSGRKPVGLRVNDIGYGWITASCEIDEYNAGVVPGCA